MGMRDLISSAVKSGLNAMGDVPVTATLREPSGATALDPVTKVRSVTYTDHVVEKAVLTGYAAYRVDNVNVMPEDKRLILVSADVDGVPDVNWVAVVAGVTYAVVTVTRDAAEASTTLQLRKVS